jgi:glycosyltransferase involved in cell wall biosynthesis
MVRTLMSLPAVIGDARCLQDPAYRERGIGQHAESLLRHRHDSEQTGLLVGLLDPSLPPLSPRCAALFDRLQWSAYAEPSDSGWFLSLSPMTHDPLRVARLLTRPGRRRAGIVYDFIPHDMPGTYLPSLSDRLDYYSRLAWLGAYDVFLPISQTTSLQLQQFVPSARPERCIVTGVAVRASLLPQPGKAVGQPPRHLLAIAGPDPRKNIEAPILAHAASAVLQAGRVPLMVAGNYPPDQRARLSEVHAAAGGDPTLLCFLPHLADDELRQSYRTAFATVAPSRAEGFSIPVIEAAANGSPVLAADCSAQAELVTQEDALFAPDDTMRLRALMERMVADPAARADLALRQHDIWRRFTEAEVATRFWGGLHAPPSAPLIGRGARPSLALLSPLPPDRTGVADYSHAVLGAIAARADVTTYTETAAPVAPSGVRIEALTPRACLSGTHDAVIAVLGNSHYHRRIFDLLLDYGGACIAHDARMLHFYVGLLGPERACALAAAELGRPLGLPEISRWIAEERSLPTFFMSEVLRASRPAFMHSRPSCALMQKAYGTAVCHLPFAALRLPPPDALTPVARMAARASLHLPGDSFAIASFGFVTPDKAPHDLIWALSMLRSWQIPASLAFVGEAPAALQRDLEALATMLGLAGHVRFSGAVDEAQWRSWLQAVDAAVQLRAHTIGSVSAGLMDCLTAGVPTVANLDLAGAIDAPDALCRRVPDHLSAVLVAEQLAEIAEAGPGASRNEAARLAYVDDHTPERYAAALLAGLGLN